jgi:hypothetical protein
MTGSAADDVRAAEHEVELGNFDAAIKRYEQLAAAAGAVDAAKPWYIGRRQELSWLKSFNAGEQVDLMPRPGDALAGWCPIRGEWSAIDGGLVASTAPDGAVLVCGATFGLRY